MARGRRRSAVSMTVPQLLNEVQRGVASAHVRYSKMLWELATADALTTCEQLLTAMKHFATVAEVRSEETGMWRKLVPLLLPGAMYPPCLRACCPGSPCVPSSSVLHWVPTPSPIPSPQPARVQPTLSQTRLLNFFGTFANDAEGRDAATTEDRLNFIAVLLEPLIELTGAKDHSARWCVDGMLATLFQAACGRAPGGCALVTRTLHLAASCLQALLPAGARPGGQPAAERGALGCAGQGAGGAGGGHAGAWQVALLASSAGGRCRIVQQLAAEQLTLCMSAAPLCCAAAGAAGRHPAARACSGCACAGAPVCARRGGGLLGLRADGPHD